MTEKAEILSRVELIEQMIAAGKRTTEHHGWVFITWGIGYLVATTRMYLLPEPDIAWSVTMSVCGVLTGVGFWLTHRAKKTATEAEHSAGGVWIATALVFIPFILSGEAYKPMTAAVVIFFIIGLANLASGNILRWWPQRMVGLLWWSCAVALANGPKNLYPVIFVFNALVCQIGFGLYLIMLDRKELHRA